MAQTKGMPLNGRVRGRTLAKTELGTKRICPNCGAKYYDLNRNPIICPRCGTQFELAAVTTRARAPAPKPVPVEEPEAEKELIETVSLEEADEEAASGGAVKTEGGEEEEEIEAGEDDTFLAPEEDEEDGVEDIVGDVDEEER